MSCQKAGAVFAEKKMTIIEERNARKSPIGGGEIWAVVRLAARVLVANGKKIVEFQPDEAERDACLPLVTGRSGTLRAPAVLIGATLYVGFSEELYQRLGKGMDDVV
jgi:hypothetical protein